MIHVDYLTVLVAAVIYMIVAVLWYSPYLFGKIWMKEVGDNINKNKFVTFPLNFLVAILLAYFISLFEIYLGATSFWDGVIAGFVIYLGFVFTTQVTSIIWVKNRWKLFLIDNGCWFISMMIMGGVLVG